MNKVCFLLLLALACKAPVDNREAKYNRMLTIAKNFQEEAKAYEHDNRPSGLKHFADAMDSVKLYSDSAITYMDDVRREQMRHIDSLVKSDVRADKRYNDSVYSARKRR